MSSNCVIKSLFSAMNEKVIAYNKSYAQITGGVTTGLMLSQLVYWARAMDYKEFYKTNKEFSEELGMSLDEFKSAKKKLVLKGFISVKRKGVPARSHYLVNVDKVIFELSSWWESHQHESGNSTNCEVGIPPTITESTPQSTTQTLTKVRDKDVQNDTLISDNPPLEEKKDKRNPDINWLLEEFQNIAGFKSSGKKDRIMATHLLRNFTRDQLSYMIRYCVEDKFAPRIGSVEKLWFKRGDILAGIKKLKDGQNTGQIAIIS